MVTHINKALDLNKLFQEHAKGKLLKKHISFPMYCPIKYDGNSVLILVERGKPTFHTSGGLQYTHTDDGGEIFSRVPDACYFAERIYGEGKLGDRNRCNLKGSKTAQTSTGHTYKVFGMIPLEDYYDGKAKTTYDTNYNRLDNIFHELDYSHYLAGKGKLIVDQRALDDWLNSVVKQGYEGVMGVDPKWKWSHHKTSRRVNLIKYKKRPTVDLLVVDAIEGTGKYEGMIGSLRVRDRNYRTVDVGSGMSDEDRHRCPSYFKGKIVEVFYESIVDTYIQPTFGSEYKGVLIRHDKTIEEID